MKGVNTVAKIPKSAKKPIARKCPICEKKFPSKYALVEHIGHVHKDNIPEGWDAARYENYLRTNKIHGTCVVCHNNTDWNPSTWKYNRICNNKKCKMEIASKADANNVKVYGKAKLLDDADMQRKMIYAKHTSGQYEWSTGTKPEYVHMYASQMEKKFLEMLDVFLNLHPMDVMSPSPNTYTYEYNGEPHKYIPDIYISSLNLEIEIKEPLDNQNMHPKIQKVDKVKERIKDEMMERNPECLYIKINGTNYSEFFELLNTLKERDDLIPKRSEELHYIVRENALMESIKKNMSINDLMDVVDNINDTILPRYDYDTMINRYKEAIKHCNSVDECEELGHEIDNLRKEMVKVITRYKGNDRMRYSATKAKDDIDTILIPSINAKMIALQENVTYYDDLLLESTDVIAYKNDKKYKPIFILLTYNHTALNKLINWWTGQPWSHASLALDTTLTRMVSFGSEEFGKMGFLGNESIQKGEYKDISSYRIYTYIAPEDEYNIMEELINTFKQNTNNLKYSIRGLFNIAFGKESHIPNEMFCSQFVSYILQQMNPKLIKKDPSLFTPGDLAETRKFIKLDEGQLQNYSPKRVDERLKKVLERKGFVNVQIKD